MDAQNKTPAGGDHAGADENNGTKSLHPNDARAQRARILKRLTSGPATTLELRRELDVLMPATRIFELRDEGLDIRTAWTRAVTEVGRSHRVALYSLHSASEGAA